MLLKLFRKKIMSTNMEIQESRWWFQWVPTSWKALQEAEAKVLSYLSTPYRGRYVDVGSAVGGEPNQIWTLSLNDDATKEDDGIGEEATGDKTPLVLVHGFGAGVALWALNLDGLAGASRRPVYAMDVLGFGRSSRPVFDSDPQAAEQQLVDSLEAWRQSLGLTRFALLGHSLGGFLASAYALRHPEYVSHLILADPWGFQDRESADEDKLETRRRNFPLWARAVVSLVQLFNPLAALRVAGPWGPRLVDRLRPDLKKKFASVVEDTDVISNYIYHCNVQTPSGEMAFKSMTTGLGWAKNPMANRIVDLDPDIPITFIYGERSWIEKESGYSVKEARGNVKIYVMPGAGHHVYADGVEMFNKLVSDAAASEDGGRRPPRVPRDRIVNGDVIADEEIVKRRAEDSNKVSVDSREPDFDDIDAVAATKKSAAKPAVLVR